MSSKICQVALLLTITGCAVAHVDEPHHELPPGCTVQAEHVRAQLCPAHPVAVVCTDVAQTNPDSDDCDGPDYTDGHQITGNPWCCEGDFD